MRVSAVNLGYNSAQKQNNTSFGTNKSIYLCSVLASGFVKSKELPELSDHIALNMNKAIKYAEKIFRKGDFPTWYHSTWPKFTNDSIPTDREMVLKGGLDLVSRCEALVYFGNPSISSGMRGEIAKAKKLDMVVLSEAEYLKAVDEGTFDKLVEGSAHYKRLHAILDVEEAHPEIADSIVRTINSIKTKETSAYLANV